MYATSRMPRALDANLGLLLQQEAEATAHGARWRALADLLPNVSGTLGPRRQVINLEAFGFPAEPSIVGPFNVFDARLFVSQPVIDIAALNDAHAAALNEQAAKFGVRTARETAAQRRLRAFGCHAILRLGSNCQPTKVDFSTFTPAITSTVGATLKRSCAKTL